MPLLAVIPLPLSSFVLLILNDERMNEKLNANNERTHNGNTFSHFTIKTKNRKWLAT
jgi:hypothetical protein